MKRKLTLLQTLKRLEKEDIVRYASKLGVEFNETWDISQMRKVYADYVLTHPKEVLAMLPFEDIKILTPSKSDIPGEPISLVNTHVLPILVRYGLAELEVLSTTAVEVTIPDDFYQAVAPHLNWAMDDYENKGRMEIELMIEGLTNLFGIVTQQEIKKYLIKLCQDSITDEQAEEVLNATRQRSLLVDSMEWREHGDETKEENILFVSRYGWDDRAAMKLFIEQRAETIPSPCEFSTEELIDAALPLCGLMPNEKKTDFISYLTQDLQLDDINSRLVCFMVWYNKMLTGQDENADQFMEAHFMSFALMASKQELSEQQLEEGLRRFTDYVNHIPLWHLRGFTATDHPSEAYVPMKKAKMKGPLGKELKRMKDEMQWVVDLMKGKNPKPSPTERPDTLAIEHSDSLTTTPLQTNQKIGRNAPCPCGSGLKYKKCCGRGL